jgi:hypothetical protein
MLSKMVIWMTQDGGAPDKHNDVLRWVAGKRLAGRVAGLHVFYCRAVDASVEIPLADGVIRKIDGLR